MSVHVIPLSAVRSALTECACWLALGACLKGGRVARSASVVFSPGSYVTPGLSATGCTSGSDLDLSAPAYRLAYAPNPAESLAGFGRGAGSDSGVPGQAALL